MDQATLAKRLAPRPVRYYDQVDSTQDLALAWLREGAPSGAVIIGDEQLRGRGRQGRTWHTPPGVALAASVILHPRQKALGQVTMLGALVIAETIRHIIDTHAISGHTVSIKWPNDVKIDGLKVSGVLPETAWDGDRLLGVALGLGLNVRVRFDDIELASVATSIEPALGVTVSRTDLIVFLLSRVDFWSARLGTPDLFDAWSALLETVGRSVSVNGIQGMAERVDRDGTLYIRDDDAVLHPVMAGDVLDRRT